MQQLSSDIPEQISSNHNNKNFDDQIPSIGSANTLKRAMTVTKLSDMLDCIKDMKYYSKTIEKDLPEYLDTIYIDKKPEVNITEVETIEFIQLAKQRLHDNRYILLNDLIKQENISDKSQLPHSTRNPHPKKSLVAKQVEYMKRVIAAQPSALEAFYLEALLNPDQWQYNHQLLQTSPIDILTTTERERLNEILYKLN